MSEAVANPSIRSGFRFSFHLWMALIMAFFVFGGFGMTYLRPLASGTLPPTPPMVHLHGAFFFSWMVLLILQSLLVNVRNIRLHRSLGNLGIALAGILFLLGVLITIISAKSTTWTNDSYGLFYLSIVAPPSFAVLMAMAISALNAPKIHRNLILLATVSILMPGINRLYMMGLNLSFVPFLATYLTMNVLVAATLLHERHATGGISRAAWIAAAVIIIPQVLMPIVVPSQDFRDFCQYLGTLAYYR
jgi:hypothetical protein